MTWERLDLYEPLKHFTPPPTPPTLNVCGTVPIWMPFAQVFTLYFCTRAHSMPCVLLLINVWSGHHSAPLKFLSIINHLLWQPTAPWILLNCVSSGRKTCLLEEKHLLTPDVSDGTNVESLTIYPESLTLKEKVYSTVFIFQNVFMLALTG